MCEHWFGPDSLEFYKCCHGCIDFMSACSSSMAAENVTDTEATDRRTISTGWFVGLPQIQVHPLMILLLLIPSIPESV